MGSSRGHPSIMWGAFVAIMNCCRCRRVQRMNCCRCRRVQRCLQQGCSIQLSHRDPSCPDRVPEFLCVSVLFVIFLWISAFARPNRRGERVCGSIDAGAYESSALERPLSHGTLGASSLTCGSFQRKRILHLCEVAQGDLEVRNCLVGLHLRQRLKVVWPEMFRSKFRQIFGEVWPQTFLECRVWGSSCSAGCTTNHHKSSWPSSGSDRVLSAARPPSHPCTKTTTAVGRPGRRQSILGGLHGPSYRKTRRES